MYKRRLEGRDYQSTRGEEAMKVESGSLQWCPVEEQEAVDTNWNTEGSVKQKTSGNISLP